MEVTTALDFSLDEITVPVTIGGDKYLLIEADSETAETFQAMVMGSLTVTQGHDGSAKRIDRMGDGITRSQSYLVSRCLKKLDAAGQRHDVDLGFVRSLKNRIKMPLYEKVREISDLKEDEAKDDQAKNS